MFLIAKTALVTCAIYVGIAILLEALLLGVTHWKGGVVFRSISRLGRSFSA